MSTLSLGSIRPAIDRIFEVYAGTSTPGCALGLTRGGQLVDTLSYGMANLEDGVPIGDRSIFHVASITKQVTAYCVTLLVQEGRLDFDDDIRRHVPEVPDFGTTITIRHLLHHTSGLRDQWDLLALAGWRAEDLVTLEDVLSLTARQQALNFEPGAEYLYCNTGYTLLALCVARISGVSFRQYAEQRLFGPLGMRNTHVHDDHAEIVPGRTQAYEPRDDAGFRISLPVFDVVGTTSLFTTVEDFAVWDRNLRDGTIGGHALVQTLQQPGVLKDGTPILYARGLMLHEYAGRRTVSHGGLDRGYRAHYVRFPSEDLALICFANVSTMRPRVRSLRIADLLFGTTEEAVSRSDVPSAHKEYIGLYRERVSGDVVRFVELDDGLAVGFDRPQPLEMHDRAVYEDPRESGTWYRFAAATQGRSLRQTSIDRDRTFVRVPSGESTPVNPAVVAGRYHSRELEVTYELVPAGRDVVLRRPKRADSLLADAGSGAMAIEELRLDFDVEHQRRASGFLASTSRARRVRFQRV